MKRFTVLRLLAVLFVLSQIAWGAVPQLVNFQGILKDGSGNPVADGSYSVIFTVYDAPVGGAVHWAETSSVSTTDGLFTVLLGSLNPVPDSLFYDPSRYLGIKVGADPEMTPRQQLSSVGYSSVSSQWTSAAQNLFRLNGNVGIGLNYPATKLHVNAVGEGIRISCAVEETSQVAYMTFYDGHGVRTGYVGDGSTGDYDVFLGSDVGGVVLYTPAGRVLTATSTGRVGIGTTSPGALLDITKSTGQAVVAIQSGDNVGSLLRMERYNSPGNFFSLEAGAASNDNFAIHHGPPYNDLVITPTGNVGIGVTTPTAKLDVVASSGIGVKGIGGGTGVYGYSPVTNGNGVVGEASTGAGAYGVWGMSSSGFAGYFSGPVTVTGFLSKAGGGFKIDHPTDPANKYLYHSFVESPDMKNIYDGVVTTNAKGEAVVTLPDWFGALNKDFRYQLTAIGAPGPNLYIAQEISGNQFKIAGGTPGMKVSWQVTGIRQDAYANAHRLSVEELKLDKERGYYLHPDLFGQPEEKSVEWAAHPEMMKEMKERRLKTEMEQK